MVYYRTYRPNTIQELDKTVIRERITSILESDSIPHALLFAGPRGTGKTSAARIFAKALNCENKTKKSIEPCNKCDNCKAITNGTHMDVIEIDAASNRGIDEIRDLKAKIVLAPSMGTHKVYIIDEVHMLTREAFNALLKTLEEPPKNVTFILATTEVHKLPDTILSRCTHLVFSKATDVEIVRSLKRVVKGEKLKISDNTLMLISKSADGSFRDAVKILEQAVVENKLSDDQIEQLIGIGNVDEIINTLLKKDLKKSLEWIESSSNDGKDFILVIELMLEDLHQKLISDPNDLDIKKLIRYLMRAYSETKTASIPQLPLELVVIEYCNI